MSDILVLGSGWFGEIKPLKFYVNNFTISL